MINNLTQYDIFVPSPVVLNERNIMEMMRLAALFIEPRYRQVYTGQRATTLSMNLVDLEKYGKALKAEPTTEKIRNSTFVADHFMGYNIIEDRLLAQSEFYFTFNKKFRIIYTTQVYIQP